MKKHKIKSLFISDIHIGCGHNNISSVLSVLNHYKYDNLYLLGDIVDGWRLRKKWRWKPEYGDFIEKLTELKADGVNVVYITGNHDDFLRKFCPLELNLCTIKNEHIRDGILMIHGDIFDRYIYNKKWIYFFGDFAYNILIFGDRLLRMGGTVSKRIKKIVKSKVNYLNDFYSAANAYTKSKKCHTLICGHTHMQEYRELKDIKYFNCGDFREDAEYIIETENGNLLTLRWK